MPSSLKIKTKSSEKTLKLSRRQKWRRNPIPWVVLLVITLLMIVTSVFPNATKWNDQKQNIKKFTTENTQLETRIDTQKKVRNQEQEKFDQLAKATLNEEAQRFPKIVNPNQVAKVLEIYALQLNLSRKTFVDLKTLSFSNARPSRDGQYQEMPVSISVDIDEASLKRLINFLQTGAYDSQLTVDTISPENKGETAALEFLDNNLLPLMHLNSINITKNEKSSQDFPRTVFSVQIQAAMFAQTE